jgi:hypothetical protein
MAKTIENGMLSQGYDIDVDARGLSSYWSIRHSPIKWHIHLTSSKVLAGQDSRNLFSPTDMANSGTSTYKRSAHQVGTGHLSPGQIVEIQAERRLGTEPPQRPNLRFKCI